MKRALLLVALALGCTPAANQKVNDALGAVSDKQDELKGHCDNLTGTAREIADAAPAVCAYIAAQPDSEAIATPKTLCAKSARADALVTSAERICKITTGAK